MALVVWHEGILAVAKLRVPVARDILVIDVDESPSTAELVTELKNHYTNATVELHDEKITGISLIDDPNLWRGKGTYDLILHMSCAMACADSVRGQRYVNLYGQSKNHLDATGTAILLGNGLRSGQAIAAVSGLSNNFYHVYGIAHMVVASWP